MTQNGTRLIFLIGLALRGPARIAALGVAVVGRLSAFVPFVVTGFVPVAPRWLGGESPVSLGYFIYFVLVAAWLADAGYSTYRQAQRPA